MSTVLITGAGGFIGSALCRRLGSGNNVIGVDLTDAILGNEKITWEQADLTNRDSVAEICGKYSPDVVIHCAGIAHQKIGAVDSATYMRVNSEATENLAKAAAECNPDVCFIFFSSVSVYGEGEQWSGVRGQGSGKTKKGKTEDGECWPSSDYAVSKLDAERRLRALYDEGTLHNLVILRLAPVYDREWSLNLDRRVFAPGKVAYLRFGPGSQRMSALARPNLVDFIAHIIQSTDFADFRRLKDEKAIKENNPRVAILNVCDAEPYEFNRIIRVFKKSGIRPDMPVISIPLFAVWFATRIAGVFLPNKKSWLHSCYDKLACDLIFNNGKMMGTGFRAIHTLETIFEPQQAHAKVLRTLRKQCTVVSGQEKRKGR